MIKIAAIGYGNRMRKYLKYAVLHPDEIELCSVVEINEVLLHIAISTHSLEPGQCFSSSNEFFSRQRDIDAVFICTPDNTHFDLAMKALHMGYHVLLEKPIACTYGQCLQLEKLASDKGLIVVLCYVLRYHPYFRKIKEILTQDWIGPIISINHVVNVGLDRTTHSFVRGPWGNSDNAGSMLLSKCCHDIDLLCWLTCSTVDKVASFGSRRWFRAENAPVGSALRCKDCRVEASCPFSSIDLYKRRKLWISNFIVPDGYTLDEIIDKEISEGNYGRCVYHCSNNVVDNQIVSMRMTNGVVVNLSMDCFTIDSNRSSVIQCAYGEIHATGDSIIVQDFRQKTKKVYDFSKVNSRNLHAGADLNIIEDFVYSIIYHPNEYTPTISRSLESHRICFLAEAYRLSSEHTDDSSLIDTRI